MLYTTKKELLALELGEEIDDMGAGAHTGTCSIKRRAKDYLFTYVLAKGLSSKRIATKRFNIFVNKYDFANPLFFLIKEYVFDIKSEKYRKEWHTKQQSGLKKIRR